MEWNRNPNQPHRKMDGNDMNFIVFNDYSKELYTFLKIDHKCFIVRVKVDLHPFDSPKGGGQVYLINQIGWRMDNVFD